MAITDLSSAQLERLVELIKEKEALQGKIAKLDEAVAAFVEHKTPKAFSRKGGSGRRASRRGKLKEGILHLLGRAGKSGLSVRELAEKLSAKPASVSVWFYTTGKKIKSIRKIGVARYSMNG